MTGSILFMIFILSLFYNFMTQKKGQMLAAKN